MSDPLAITAEDADGLARLAQAQLRLALRFAERAEATEDVDDACRLARASERAARGYRQALLIKARLQRDRDAALREAVANPIPPSAEDEARRFRRCRDLYGAVERIACETIGDQDELDFILQVLADQVDAMMAEDADFSDADIALQVARLREDLGLVDPQDLPDPGGQNPDDPADTPAPPDSS